MNTIKLDSSTWLIEILIYKCYQQTIDLQIRIHQLHLCKGVPPKNGPGYDTK